MSQLVPSDQPKALGRPLDYLEVERPGLGYSELDAQEINLRATIDMLRRHWRLVFVITAAVLAVAAYNVYSHVPQYRARATIRVADARKAITGGIDDGIGPLLGKTSDPLLSHIQVLRSRAVIGQVVDRHGLQLRPLTPGLNREYLQDAAVRAAVRRDTVALSFGRNGYRTAGGNLVAYGVPITFSAGRLTVTARPDVASAEIEVVSRDAAIDNLLAGLRTSRRENTDLVDVEYVNADPVTATMVVNAVIETFQAYNATLAQQQSQRRRIFLEEQLEQTDSTLVTAQQGLSAFRSRNQLYSSRERLAAEQTGMMTLDMRREEMAAEKRMYQQLLGSPAATMNANRLQALVSAPGIAANPLIIQLSAQLALYETKRDSLTSGVWSAAKTNPDVTRLDTLIASTRAKLAVAAASHVASLEARVRALDELKSRTSATMTALPATEVEEMVLVQQVETTRRIADQLREEYQRARIAEAVEVGPIEVLDRATIPQNPIPSRSEFKLILGLLIGLSLGAGAAYLREHLNTSIRHQVDIEEILRVPNLAIVPGASNSKRKFLPFRNSVGSATNGRFLVSIAETRSPAAEAYRRLRTNLIFSQAAGRLRTIAVTSPLAAEGKTTTAANLAVAFAQQGISVLLIDCDLRKAQVHKMFNLPREPGFTDLVLGQVTLADVARPGPIDQLMIITSGMLPPNPAELLGGVRARQVFETLSTTADLVIIDTPPVLLASDASVISKIVDGMVMVIRAGQTDRSGALQAIQQLRNVGGNILGAVLNDPDHESDRYGGYYYGYQYYGEEA